MRRDLYTAAVVSLGLHYGLASFNPAKTERVIPQKEETIYIPWSPKSDEPLEERASDEVREKTSPPPTISPPSLPDVPRTPTPDAVVVPMQPPHQGIIDRTAIAIPDGYRTGSGGPEGVFDLSKLDQSPVAKFQTKPVYPFEMRRQGESGEVWVDFIVDPVGNVRDAYAVRSTRREFEEAAVQAVRKWKFQPGKKDERAVSTHMQVPILFRLSSTDGRD